MEQKEKNEKPAWVACIDELCPASRQNVGSTCASAIQALVTIWHISHELYDAVIDACNGEIYNSPDTIHNEVRNENL